METVRLGLDGTLLDGHGTVMGDALACLGLPLDVTGQTYSLRGFFALLDRYPDLLRVGHFLAAAHAEAQTCPTAGCTTPGIEHLELTRTVELTGFPGDPRLDSYHTVRGITAEGPQEIRFIQLDGLLDLPLHFGKLRHVVFGDHARVLACDTSYRLFDLVEALAWEFGFQGGSRHCTIGR